MKRKAFALLEVLVVVGIVTTIGMFGVPLWSQYSARQDMALAKNQIIQGLQRARANAMAGKEDSSWGFRIPNGVLFRGDTYTEDLLDDTSTEVYSMPETVAFSGLTEVIYDKSGNPDQTGTITLRAFNSEIDSIEIVLSVALGSVDTTVGGSLTICYNSVTLSVTDAAWPSYQSRGAILGSCAGGGSSSSAASSTASSVASSSSSAGGSSGGTGGGMGGTDCATKFTEANNVLTTVGTSTLTFTNIAALRQYGTNGPYIPTHYCYSTDNGSSYTKMFQGNGNCSGNSGNAYGNAVSQNGGETSSVSLTNGKNIVWKIRWRYQTQGSLAVNDFVESKFKYNSNSDTVNNNGTYRVVYLKDGDNPTSNAGYWSQPSLSSLLQSRGYLDGLGKVNLACNERIAVAEGGTMPGDFNDAILKLSFN